MRTLIETLRPKSKALAVSFEVLVVLAGAFLIAVAAQVSVPLPFTPIPVSLQTFAVLMIGGFFGVKRGVATVLAYITEGVLGLPVFAGGAFGMATLLGPRGGYLLGFVVAAALIGYFIQKIQRKSIPKLFLSFFIAHSIILVCGGLWLSLYVGPTQAYLLGIAPFLLGEVVKVTLLTALFHKTRLN